MTTPTGPELVPYTRFKERSDEFERRREFAKEIKAAEVAIDQSIVVAAEQPVAEHGRTEPFFPTRTD